MMRPLSAFIGIGLFFAGPPALAQVGSNQSLSVGSDRTETVDNRDADIAACKKQVRQTPKTDFGTVMKGGGANEIILDDAKGGEESGHEAAHAMQQKDGAMAGSGKEEQFFTIELAQGRLKDCLEARGYKVIVRGWDPKKKKNITGRPKKDR